MKKTLVFLVSALALLSCQKEGADLNITRNELTFDAAGGSQNVRVNTAAAFSVEAVEADWYLISYSQSSTNAYGVVSVTVQQNKSASSRGGEFVIKTPSKEERVTFIQTRPAVPANPAAEEKTLNSLAHTLAVSEPEAYEAQAVSSVDWITLNGWTASVAANATGLARTGTISVTTTDNQTIYTITVNQAAERLLEGELLIEEIFFTGTLLPNGRTATGEQYIKITNNSDELVYADGLLFCMSSYYSQRASTGSYWIPKEPLTDKIGVSTLYAIPGDGDDVPVQPGASLVLAMTADDFSENGGKDLSKADFEIYVDFYGLDTDNPDVPNLDLWAKASASIVILHGRGYESYALVLPPSGMTAETLIADYPWIGEEEFYLFGELFRTRDILSGNYALPNDWVIDGVNCGVPQFLGDLAFNAAVDAGYTGCGEIDDDPDRYGKSALRKSNGGKLVDTNNSTNDFTRDATPTL